MKQCFFTAALFGILLFALSGCSGQNDARNPLLQKARRYQNDGDAKLAEQFYRRMLEKYPNSAEAHRGLATLCDEALGELIPALYHYEEFLKLAPDSADAEIVKRFRDLAKIKLRRLLEKEAGTSAASDSGTAARLARENQMLRKRIRQQNEFIQNLTRKQKGK